MKMISSQKMFAKLVGVLYIISISIKIHFLKLCLKEIFVIRQTFVKIYLMFHFLIFFYLYYLYHDEDSSKHSHFDEDCNLSVSNKSSIRLDNGVIMFIVLNLILKYKLFQDIQLFL